MGRSPPDARGRTYVLHNRCRVQPANFIRSVDFTAGVEVDFELCLSNKGCTNCCQNDALVAYVAGGIKVGLKLRLPNKGCQACGYGDSNAGSKPSASTSDGAIHTVVKGDTAYGLMRKYGISIADLKRINPNVNLDALPLGTKLLVDVNGKKTGTCPMCGGVPAGGKLQAVAPLLTAPLAGISGAGSLAVGGVQNAGNGIVAVVKLAVRVLKFFPGIVKKLPPGLLEQIVKMTGSHNR
eukprot:1178653-Prorocentrum_minimum.AAC.2